MKRDVASRSGRKLLRPALMVGAFAALAGGCDEATNQTTTGAAPAAQVSPAGQSLVGVDPVNKAVWVPVYTLDAQGNLQFAIVTQASITPAAPGTTATKAATTGKSVHVSLPKCDTPIATTFDANNESFLIECAASSSGQIFVQIVPVNGILTTTTPQVNTIPATGVTLTSDAKGGIIFNPNTNTAVVAGTQAIGLLTVPVNGTATFNAASVTTLPIETDSLSLNFTTQQLFVANDGEEPVLVDTSKVTTNTDSPLAVTEFETTSEIVDGNVFDPATNVVALSTETSDNSQDNVVFVYNMATLNTKVSPATADTVTVSGLGTPSIAGEGPGGVAALNSITHQAIIADEFGPNFWLMQLPTATPAAGALNNNGQPGTTTTANSSSAFAIAASIVPSQTINGTATPLGIRGDPSAAGVDQVNNIAYFMADNNQTFHTWSENNGLSLFLVAVDLSKPVLGACPTCKTQWNPNIAVQQIQ